MPKTKKADSQMVSYVLLVVIAISLSVAVYAYLRYYLPSNKEKCPEEVTLIIEDAACSQNKLNITVSNRGLFNVSMIFVRLDKEEKQVRRQVNKGNETLPNPLAPGQFIKYVYTIPSDIVNNDKNYIVEIQPAILTEKRTPALCNAIVAQPVSCT